MRVWLFQIGEPLPVSKNVRKMRTSLVAEEFVRQGWDVTWFTSAFDHQKKEWIEENSNLPGLSDSCELIYLKGKGYSKNISMARFHDHRLVAKDFEQRASSFDVPDLIVASMPTYDLSYQAFLYAKKNKVPIFIDVRDRWPDVFFDFAPAKLQKLLKKTFYSEYKMLSEQLNQADGLLSMMEPMLEWALNISGRKRTDRDKVFYLGAERFKPMRDKASSLETKCMLNDGRKTISFVGTFGNYNNPEIICEVAKQFSPDKYKFIIAGHGDYFESVREAASDLPHVFLPGWVDQDEIYHLLSKSSLSILPMTKSVDAFPNKAFVYLSSGVPIISSCPGDMKKLLNQYKAGLFYESGDLNGLGACLRILLENNRLLECYQKGAQRLFDEKLNSDVIYREYVDHVIERGLGR